MKKLLFVMSILVMAIGGCLLASCGGGDDEEKDGGGDSSTKYYYQFLVTEDITKLFDINVSVYDGDKMEASYTFTTDGTLKNISGKMMTFEMDESDDIKLTITRHSDWETTAAGMESYDFHIAYKKTTGSSTSSSSAGVSGTEVTDAILTKIETQIKNNFTK